MFTFRNTGAVHRYRVSDRDVAIEKGEVIKTEKRLDLIFPKFQRLHDDDLPESKELSKIELPKIPTKKDIKEEQIVVTKSVKRGKDVTERFDIAEEIGAVIIRRDGGYIVCREGGEETSIMTKAETLAYLKELKK